MMLSNFLVQTNGPIPLDADRVPKAAEGIRLHGAITRYLFV
jgi:hypothetical protein